MTSWWWGKNSSPPGGSGLPIGICFEFIVPFVFKKVPFQLSLTLVFTVGEAYSLAKDPVGFGEDRHKYV
tara:strand:- start:880 stop:1086 length:207 start_codon:yes stop_codon:yes gene_type:complete